MKILFHCHTETSPCSNLKEKDLVRFLDKNGFDAVIVTDHDERTIINWPGGLVIPGSEITSAEGDVIGLFLSKKIPKGLSIAETSSLIHKQGGVVVAPHPSDKLRREAMSTRVLIKNIEHFDVIETYNSRNVFNSSNKEAAAVAKQYGIPGIAGSDSHTFGELPNTFINMPSFSDAKTFIDALSGATWKTKASGPIPHIKTIFIRKIGRLQKHRL